MGDLAKCLDELVKDNALSRDQAEEVLREVKRTAARNAQHMTLSDAERAAAEQVLKARKAKLQEDKLDLARTVLKTKEVDDAMAEHAWGPQRGALSYFTKDPSGLSARPNVEYRARTLFEAFDTQALALFQKFAPRAAGFVENLSGYRAIVRELFGEDSGDPLAKAAAKAFSEVAEQARQMFVAAGGRVGHLATWRLPQAHDAIRINKAGEAAWSRFVDDLGVQIYDDLGNPLRGLERMAALKAVWETLSSGGLNKMAPAGGLGRKLANSRSDHRVLHFISADAWLKYHERFGQNSIYGALGGHLKGMADDIAALEILGPNPDAMVRYMRDRVRQMSRDPSAGGQVEWTWRALRGNSVVVTGPLRRTLYALMQNSRDWLRSAQMGSAVVSAVSDHGTMKATADWNGLSGLDVEMNYLRQLNPADATDRQAARELGLLAELTLSGMNEARVAQNDLGRGFSGKLAQAVFTASGLNAHTHGGQAAFGLSFLKELATQAGQTFDQLEPVLRGSLQRGGLDDRLWNAARSAPTLDVHGVRFLNPLALAGAEGPAREAGLRLHAHILQEIDMAVPMADARVRGLMSMGTQGNTFLGEMVKSGVMYRSFGLSVLLTHLDRARGAASDAFIGEAVQYGMKPAAAAALSYGLGLAVTMTVLGAVAIQARQILTGKDLRDMTDPRFWGAAALQGGGFGILGDFFNAAIARTDKDLAGTLNGPSFGLVGDVLDFTTRSGQAALQGHRTNTTAELINFLQHYQPGSNLWYARLALDRMFYAQLKLMADPTAPRAFARMERRARTDYGQQFWWRPGEAGPARLPDFTAAVGNH